MKRILLELKLYIEGVEEIASKNKRILCSEHRMNPSGGDENSLTLFDHQLVAFVNHVTEESLTLAAQPLPSFVQGQIVVGGLDKIEYLLAFENVVPHRCTTKINMPICNFQNT
jgi:hypothetical protein